MNPSGVAPLQRNWGDALSELIAQAKAELLIAAPFITLEGTRLVLGRIPKAICATGRLFVLTDLSPAHVCDGSLDPAAVSALYDAVRTATLWHIPGLHAKVYIADAHRAIVTSGNLTASALFRNLEYGMDVSDSALVRTIIDHFAVFRAAGTAVSRDQLGNYVAAAEELQAEFVTVKRSASASATRRFRQALRKAEDDLIRLRLAAGAMHTVFARTIAFLLRKYGSMSTVQIHRRIQELYPDLCDDAVDRVIDGKHYGKKWKHAVRTAQQMLKKRGDVTYSNGMWESEGLQD